MHNNQGFTLIEMMVVVAIIGILAAIAYPSYIQYKIRTNRADVQTEMMRVAQRLQSYYVINHNYTNARLENNTLTSDYPTVGAVYTITLATTGQTYTLTASPRASTVQVGNGWLCLNSQGQKSWTKGVNSCSLSAISNWTGN